MALSRIDIGIARDERLPAALLLIFFIVLCVAGGASRGDVVAQVIVRAFAVGLMLVQVGFGRLPDIGRYQACVMLLASMMGLAAVQLIPLPPVIWTALPGRALIASSPLGVTGWRPLNLAPDAGWNALFSLLAPLCTVVLLSALRTRTVWRVQYLLIGAAIFSALLALLQAAGSAPDNPLINGSVTDYAGTFANRNHQALFLSIGIVLAWFWGAGGRGGWRNRRLWLSICIIALLFASVLVTGSRSGALLGVIATVVAPMLAFSLSRRRSGGKGHVLLWPAIALVFVAGVVLLSAYFGRAASLSRATDLAMSNEFRLRALPAVWDTAKTYLPFGAGLGTFDNVFRIAEPFSLLEPTYYNHAHNDLLETVIETGIFGPAIFLCAMIWGLRRIMASPSQNWENARMIRMGALIVGLVIFASVSDYPARTPMIMVALMVAACWLTGASREGRETMAASALPGNANPL